MFHFETNRKSHFHENRKVNCEWLQWKKSICAFFIKIQEKRYRSIAGYSLCTWRMMARLRFSAFLLVLFSRFQYSHRISFLVSFIDFAFLIYIHVQNTKNHINGYPCLEVELCLKASKECNTFNFKLNCSRFNHNLWMTIKKHIDCDVRFY
jgi:hypothetical protein